MLNNRTDNLWRIAAIAWGVAAVGVWAWTTSYGFTTYQPTAGVNLSSWPTGTRLTLDAERPTLVVFLHPRCPCTRASIRELERVLTGAGLSGDQQPRVIVTATLPADADEQWRRTDTVRDATALPYANVAWDVDGVEASRFGAATSGAVRLYASSGELLFAGGVTPSRGHEGDSAGRDRLLALLRGDDTTPQPPTPVFGCRLCLPAPTADAPAGAERVAAALN